MQSKGVFYKLWELQPTDNPEFLVAADINPGFFGDTSEMIYILNTKDSSTERLYPFRFRDENELISKRVKDKARSITSFGLIIDLFLLVHLKSLMFWWRMEDHKFLYKVKNSGCSDVRMTNT